MVGFQAIMCHHVLLLFSHFNSLNDYFGTNHAKEMKILRWNCVMGQKVASSCVSWGPMVKVFSIPSRLFVVLLFLVKQHSNTWCRDGAVSFLYFPSFTTLRFAECAGLDYRYRCKLSTLLLEGINSRSVDALDHIKCGPIPYPKTHTPKPATWPTPSSGREIALHFYTLDDRVGWWGASRQWS